MEKSEINSLDLRFLVRELRNTLVNGIVRKIYQYEYVLERKKSHQFLFEIFVPNTGEKWLYFDRNKIFITNYKKPSPAQPPSFCLFLRKHLNNSKILEIDQHEFDRIIEIKTDKNVVIIELFSEGNVILCDSERKIIMPLYVQRWKDRDVRPKIQYQYPPAKINPFAVGFEYFREFLSRFDKKIIAVLAAGFGFGQFYAKEICLLSKISEDTPSDRIGVNLSVHLFNTIRELDNLPFRPTIYEDFVSPFVLEGMKDKKIRKQTPNLSEALDEFFSEQQIRLAEEFEERIKEKQTEKMENVLRTQKEAMGKWTEKREEKRTKADLIYSHYGAVEGVLDLIRDGKSSGLSWEEIKYRAKHGPEARVIKEIREHEGKVVIELEGQGIELDFRKSVEENAEDYYKVSRHAKKKVAGVLEAMEETKKRMERETRIERMERPARAEKEQKKWFEKFRWFFSSDGFLVVGGKDATSNEVLIKKYTEARDMVFHSTIQGSPFVVVKSEGREIPAATKKEAAEFAAAYSKAWQSGLGIIDVYCIKPGQVSKQARPGEYLPKGSFMIYGEREWFKNVELRMAIGVARKSENGVFEIVSGPVSSVEKKSDYFAVIKPGDLEAGRLASKARIKILMKASPEHRTAIEKIPLEDFQRAIPGGKGEIVEYGV